MSSKASFLKTFAMLFLAGIIVSACGGTTTKKQSPQPNLPALETAAMPTEVVEIPSPMADETEAEVAIAEPAPEPIIVSDDPQQFINLDIHEISKLIGAPLLVRRDGNAEVWQYKGNACTLDVFLYEVNANLRVKYVDLRGNADMTENRACMAEILRQHIRHMS